jgi:hypothetical protein
LSPERNDTLYHPLFYSMDTVESHTEERSYYISIF